MEIKGIKYVGPIFDNSGYARACRGNILALHNAGVPITINSVSFEKIKPDIGKEGEILKSLVDRRIDYNINIMHSTPEFWKDLKINNVINIGYTIWETTKLHPSWVPNITNNADKLFVGCEWNKKVFIDSGVNIPISVIPHGIDPDCINNTSYYNIEGVREDDYVFYGIFQWTERKHPTALIKAYYSAFTGVKDVVLVLKTYRSDYSESEKDAIRNTLRRLKIIMPMDHYPKIVYISNILTEDEIMSLHKRGDCYVSLDRGEGFGLGPFTAGAYGKPIIITGFGGATEYAKPNNSYLVDYSLTPVFGMPWSSWYKGDQMWAEPNIEDGINKMKYVYNNREDAEGKGLKLQKDVLTNFSWPAIADKIIDSIRSI